MSHSKLDLVAPPASSGGSSSTSTSAASTAAYSQPTLLQLHTISLDCGLRIIFSAGSVLEFVGDAIVNAANEGGTGGFGVDEAVNKAGGYELKQARKVFDGIETGTAKVTGSFEHSLCQHIIHAVGPVYRLKHGMMADSAAAAEYLKSKDTLLVDAYHRSLDCAGELKLASVGFSLLSAGVFRGVRSLNEILTIAVRAVAGYDYSQHKSLREVHLVAYTKEEQDELVSAAKALELVLHASTYKMSHSELGLVAPRLYVGSLQAAQDAELLSTLNITHVLTAAARLNPFPNDTPLQNLCLEGLADHPAADILQDIPRSLKFISEGLDSGGSVLVHCASGVSRSVSICCAWLMLTSDSDHTLEAALQAIRKDRSQANPNAGFKQQLLSLEETLVARLSEPKDDASSVSSNQWMLWRRLCPSMDVVEEVIETSRAAYAARFGTSDIMSLLCDVRSAANDLHFLCDEQENILKGLGKNPNQQKLEECGQALLDIVSRLDTLAAECAETQIVDRPAKMIRKSAASKAARLLEDIEKLKD